MDPVNMDPLETLEALNAKLSPALTRRGPFRVTARDCVLCGPGQDCRCAEIKFGSAEYMARLDALHGRAPRPADAPLCSAAECPVTERCGTHTPGIAVSGGGLPTVACTASPEGEPAATPPAWSARVRELARLPRHELARILTGHLAAAPILTGPAPVAWPRDELINEIARIEYPEMYR
jgi:hypothetical protein